jgi:hypothetical protein
MHNNAARTHRARTGRPAARAGAAGEVANELRSLIELGKNQRSAGPQGAKRVRVPMGGIGIVRLGKLGR